MDSAIINTQLISCLFYFYYLFDPCIMAAKLQLKERYITCKLFVSEVITSAVHHRLLVTVPINRNTTKSSCNKTDLNRCTTTEIRWNNCSNTPVVSTNRLSKLFNCPTRSRTISVQAHCQVVSTYGASAPPPKKK